MATATRQTLPDIVLDLSERVGSDVDFYAYIQDHVDQNEEQSTFAQSLWGKRAANFLDSHPGIDAMVDSWAPVRILGKGGFGLVGLWRRTGPDGEIEDEIAIKEIKVSILLEVCGKPHLAEEAAIMQQLNRHEKYAGFNGGATSVIRLRNFRYYKNAQLWRFFIEFAPYGDLYALKYAYKSWDQYLPEEFLWHVFYSLAHAAYMMGTFDFTDPATGDTTKRKIVHFDIKPENTFMAKPHTAALLPNYPTIKLGDFGGASLTGPDDSYNPSCFRRTGTIGFQPPVRAREKFTHLMSWLIICCRNKLASPSNGTVALTVFNTGSYRRAYEPVRISKNMKSRCLILVTNSCRLTTSGLWARLCMTS
jgi:serine/threonine protein kinase